MRIQQLMPTFVGASRRKLVEPFVVGALLLVAASVASAQEVAMGGTAQASVTPLTLGEIFTFLFVTLGPFKVLGPFASMTRGRDNAFKLRLAMKGTGIAAIALVVAATAGAKTLRDWRVSTEALLLAGGIVLFLVALQLVLQQYAPSESRSEAQESATVHAASSSLAFSPLAFPTIVTPYGIAVLILVLRLRPVNTAVVEILALTAVVLVVDLLAMLLADRILKTPFVASALNVVGAVMSVLQVALGVEIMLFALRLLGVIGPGRVGA
jgi:multiple antibiotic resistance protein